MEQLLAVKDLDYPVGWLRNGKYSNHHEMDVMALFHFGWPYMSDGLRKRAAVEIRKVCGGALMKACRRMVRSRSPAAIPLRRRPASAHRCWIRRACSDKGQALLDERGFPEAAAARARIIRFVRLILETGGAGGTYYRHLLEDLGAAANR